MLAAAKEKMLAPSIAARSGEEIFFLAAGVGVPALETRQGANAARGEKPHQGIFVKNRRLRVRTKWVKWSGTHQDSGRSWFKTVLGSALDANGNTLSDPSGKSYTWDFENRLVQAVVPGTGTVTFKYDPFGRRIQKSGPLGATNYLSDGANLIEELDTAGNVLAKHTHGPASDEPLAQLRSSITNFYENDAAGSITSLSSSAGALSATYSYDSYGKSIASTGTVTNPFQYTGREFDSETGLYFYRARYSDPSTGRFLSEDPLSFGSDVNFYAYAFNNPIAYTDPSGKGPGLGVAPALGGAGAGAGLGAGFGAEIATGSAGGPIGALVVIIGVTGTYDYYQGKALCQAMGWCGTSPAPNPTPGPYPAPLDWHSDQAQSSCKNNGCKPCKPPVGTIGYRLDTTGPPHRGLPVPHWHLKVVQQSPAPMCQCQWVEIPDNQGGFGGGPVPTNTVPMSGPAGGGAQ
jgi:RHS repeat-associated protein